MSRITNALDKLRQKCTEAGMNPKGNGTADILECIAEHFAVGGGKDEYELKTRAVRTSISSSEVKATLDPSDATDAEVIAALKSVWRIVGNNQCAKYQPFFIADTNYNGSVMRWGAYQGSTLFYPIQFDTASNELVLSTDEGREATLSYLAPKA